SVSISGVGVAGYNGTFTVASVPSPTTFTYINSVAGLASSSNGTAAAPNFVGNGNFSLTGDGTVGVTITFIGALGGGVIPLIQVASTNLAGGAVTVANVVTGVFATSVTGGVLDLAGDAIRNVAGNSLLGTGG